jgi:hypothetical protein
MTAATLTRPNARSTRTKCKTATRQISPAKPDKQLWKTDKDKAFEAGVQWFLSVSRNA